jgi:hypothetical protein
MPRCARNVRTATSVSFDTLTVHRTGSSIRMPLRLDAKASLYTVSIDPFRVGRGPGDREREPASPLDTPWYAFSMKKRPDWPKLPAWKTFKGLQGSRGFGTPPGVLRELVAQGKKGRQQPAAPAPPSPERAAKGARGRAAK